MNVLVRSGCRRCAGARSNWMQIANYLAERLYNNNSNQIFPVVVVLRSLSNLSLCNGQTFSIYRRAFFNIVITRTKSISTRSKIIPLTLAVGNKLHSWNVKTFNFVYFTLNQTENLLELKEGRASHGQI